MKVLHIVKTADGARWAALQAKVLCDYGVEVHVALPTLIGESIPYWQASGATLHHIDFSLPLSKPIKFYKKIQEIKEFINNLEPDLLHSHFVTTTIMLRIALGKKHTIPRIFQVPGPLHLEHSFFRILEIISAGKNDYWICSSKYIKSLYEKANVDVKRLYLSYYGTGINDIKKSIEYENKMLLYSEQIKYGNINYMYPPKKFLGQIKGLKRHEDLIDAMEIVGKSCGKCTMFLIGGQWGTGRKYENNLRNRARKSPFNNITFLGKQSVSVAPNMWKELDCAVHVPISENCGGVVEPLLHSIPVIASRVGGLPEVIIDGYTGWLVPPKNPNYLAKVIVFVSKNLEEAKKRAKLGHQLVIHMFDVNRTGKEVYIIYQHVLDISKEHPKEFDSKKFIEKLVECNGYHYEK